jgi:hypothetical protein
MYRMNFSLRESASQEKGATSYCRKLRYQSDFFSEPQKAATASGVMQRGRAVMSCLEY